MGRFEPERTFKVNARGLTPLRGEARGNLLSVMSLRPEALRGAGAGTQVAGEVDYRPRHPLVRHAQVKPLDPDELDRLTLDGAAGDLIRRLAECATGEAPPALGSSEQRRLQATVPEGA